VTNSTTSAGPGGSDPAVLSISEVAQRTGIPVAGLRNWEQRYGLPRPQRSASGQRRYRESDCTLLTEVLRHRDGGLSLPAAIAQATSGAARQPATSIFAGIRSRHPELRVHLLSKPVMLALSWAIEDECCARAQRPILVGAFQRQHFFESARLRWADLARSAEQTVVFADFERSQDGPGALAEVAVPESSPMRREWALVCDAPDQPACVIGWEQPGQDDRREPERVFEALWSADPRVVRTAARIGVGLAVPSVPGLAGRLEARLSEEPGPSSADLRRASGLLERTLDYLAH